MRILMLGVKEYPYGISSKFEKFSGGGTAKYVIGLSNILVENGHTVDLIVRKMPGQSKYENFNNLYIYRVKWVNNKYFRLPSFSFFSFIFSFRLIKKVDVIHAHGSFDAITAFILSRLYKKKFVVNPHGLTSYQSSKKYIFLASYFTRLIEKIGFKAAHKLVFLSPDEQKLIEDNLNIKYNNSCILNMGIPPLKAEWKYDSKQLNILYIGRLVPIKGIDNLIKSIKLLPPPLLDKTKLYIVGDGFYRKELELLVIQENLTQKVIFTGFTNEIEKYFSLATFFILPSEGGEGLPVSLLEAMSSGVPAIVSNFTLPNNCNSIINIADNAPISIAKAIETYYTDEYKIQDISTKSKIDFYKFFSIDSAVKAYIKMYEEL